MQIRCCTSDDAATLAALYADSVRVLGARDYSAEQLAAWLSRAPAASRLQALMDDGRDRWLAVDAQGALGFLDLEADGHIHFFYCAPRAAGTGVAVALYREMERSARRCGIGRLYVEASEAARRFFLKRDFVQDGRRDFEIDGVPIHNYAMHKHL